MACCEDTRIQRHVGQFADIAAAIADAVIYILTTFTGLAIIVAFLVAGAVTAFRR